MTEAEWLAATEPHGMLWLFRTSTDERLYKSVQKGAPHFARSARKLRLLRGLTRGIRFLRVSATIL
jgi:hypothetical protein